MNLSGSSDNKFHNKDRLAYLDTMRAIAILMVVGIHTLGYSREMPKTTYTVISFFVRTIAVPVFFLVDGFLFARMNMRGPRVTDCHYIKKSAIRLLLPWLIFVIGYTGMRYLFEQNNFLETKLVVGQSLLIVAKNSYGSVIAPQLYFLFSLFLIRTLIPLTKHLFQICRYSVLFLSIAFIILYRLPTNYYLVPYLKIEGGQEPILHAIWGFQFYMVGISLYLFREVINKAKAFYVLFSLLCLSFVIHVPENIHFLKTLISQYLYLLSLYFGIECFPEKYHLVSSVGANTMGIYLLHAPIMIKALSIPINYLITIPILSYVSLALIVFVFSYYLTIIISKIPYGSLLFGVPYKGNVSTTA